MIINKQGEKCLCCNGVEYIIGEEVIGTENGDYEGLIGRIYEIRIGEADKETDNDTSDFYCTFEPPILEPDIRKLEERFSQIYGSPKSLNEICLDSVILAPDMVKPVSSILEKVEYFLYRLYDMHPRARRPRRRFIRAAFRNARWRNIRFPYGVGQ